MGGVERVDDGGGDAASVGDLVAVAARPVADDSGLFATGTSVGAAVARGRGASATGTAGVLGPGREVLAQGGSMVGGEVDLVGHTVESEGNRLVCSLIVVEVVNELDGRLLGHGVGLLKIGDRNRSYPIRLSVMEAAVSRAFWGETASLACRAA